MSTAVWRSVWW